MITYRGVVTPAPTGYIWKALLNRDEGFRHSHIGGAPTLVFLSLYNAPHPTHPRALGQVGPGGSRAAGYSGEYLMP